MNGKHYYICKKGNDNEIVYISYDKIKGYGFTPRNNVKYNGIVVNKLVIIKPSMIEKILKKKIKRKLDIYLKLIIEFIDSEDGSTGDSIREALNDLSKYKDIVQYKYRKYLDDKYFQILMKKIAILEYELNTRLVNIREYEEEKTSHRSR